MDKTTGICPIFDGIGLASLVVAIFALGGTVWFLEAGTQGSLLTVFQIAFATSIAAFLSARAIQIINVIRTTPDPKTLRAIGETRVVPTPDGASDGVLAGEIRRAA